MQLAPSSGASSVLASYELQLASGASCAGAGRCAGIRVGVRLRVASYSTLLCMAAHLRTSPAQTPLPAGRTPCWRAGRGFAQPVRKPVRLLEHHDEDGIILCHRGSAKLLVAQLPLLEDERGSVFLLGEHDGALRRRMEMERGYTMLPWEGAEGGPADNFDMHVVPFTHHAPG